MSGTQDVGLEVFVTGLRNQHAVENQALALLQRQIERIENYPEAAERMRQHVTETQQQITRLDELLEKSGSSASAMKDFGLSMGGNMAALAHTVAPDEIIKDSFANYAFEHYEIAAYKSLLVLADAVGRPQAKATLEASLVEEVAMSEWIDQHLADTTRRFLERKTAGLKAGL